jgi:hypothetical protein
MRRREIITLIGGAVTTICPRRRHFAACSIRLKRPRSWAFHEVVEPEHLLTASIGWAKCITRDCKHGLRNV